MDLQQLREKCIEDAKRAVAESVNEDNFIIQAITNYEELDEIFNTMVMRAREWYGLYFPELARKIHDNEAFVHNAGDKKKLMKELGIKGSMGGDLSENDLNPIMKYLETARSVLELRNEVEKYLEQVMSSYCWNMMAVAGAKVGAKLLAEAGSLKRMAMMPSTAIQMLGAEKALFRHLKTGAKPPRHGHIFAHPLVQGVKDEDRGKVSRTLADKIALAARADYFGEKFIGEELRKELEDKWKRN